MGQPSSAFGRWRTRIRKTRQKVYHPIQTYENKRWARTVKRKKTVRERLPEVTVEDPDVKGRSDQRTKARCSNDGLSYATSDAEAHRRYLDHRAQDPFNHIDPALLNSAHIADYIAKTGMIFPFNPRGLKSASYEIPLRGPYVFIDKKGKRKEGILEADDELVVPRNSITFLTVEPYFRLPDYIALRHNLKIDHIYKGLLVGTGPLIDPGFVGRISLPLHNLTNNEYTFKTGEGMIWVEFTKLSKLPNPLRPDATSKGRYVSYDATRTRNLVVTDYVRSAVQSAPVPASSTAVAEQRVDKMRSLIAKTTTFGAFAVIVFMVALFSVFLTLPLDSVHQDSNRQQEEIMRLQQQVERLQEQLSPAQPAAPSMSAQPAPAPTR